MFDVISVLPHLEGDVISLGDELGEPDASIVVLSNVLEVSVLVLCESSGWPAVEEVLPPYFVLLSDGALEGAIPLDWLGGAAGVPLS